MIWPMHEALLRALKNQRPTLLARWESLLRADPSPNALGNPDLLVLMMDWTLEEWESTLRRPNVRQRRGAGVGASAARAVDCPCGQNPLLGYFRSAETALDEALAQLTAPHAGDDIHPAEWGLARDAFTAEARRALRQVADREVSTFCAVCRQRNRFVARTADPPTKGGKAGSSPLTSPVLR
jgi:hypothetical protein